jgi:hypothetical protein
MRSDATIEAKFQSVIDYPWTEIMPISLGDLPSGLGTSDIYVLITEYGKPLYRLDLYCDIEAHVVKETIVWQEFVVIGCSQKLYLLSLATGQVESFELVSYFSKLYPSEKLLLVATAERLFGFNHAGQLQWVSDCLGIDGVVVEQIDAGIASGFGEWDPPGGWRSFRVDLVRGKRM